MAMALGLESVDQLASQLEFLMKAKPPKSFKDALKLLRNGIDLRHARPRSVKSAPCQEVVNLLGKGEGGGGSEGELFTLDHLPILKCWPKDGGRFITLPTVYTKDPDTGERNVGMYRIQIYDGATTGMHWQVHKVGARHGKRYYERGEKMPVAICLGGDPTFTLAATAPLPDGIDEILFAGFARKKSVDLVKCVTQPLEVPAESDFVIEGR
jgi:4-hydroxy-3-polyprenylbenzoate decarboxylase